jgi:hypothetical protein
MNDEMNNNVYNLIMDYKSIIQVVLGVVVVFTMYVISMYALRMDEAVQDSTGSVMKKQKRALFDGYVDASLLSEYNWNTVNQGASNYVNLSRSYNRKGGAQFSYSFWLKLRNTDPRVIGGRTILMRGDPRRYTWTKEFKMPGTDKRMSKQTIHDVMIKCPCIRFGNTFDSMTVEFNTVNNPHEKFTIRPRPEFTQEGTAEDASHRYNFIKLTQKRWTMFTFTFEDNVAINDFEDGVVVRFYVNDQLYHSHRTRGTIKQNNGNLYALPGPNQCNGANMGNLTYFNYAMGISEVIDMFKQGPPKRAAKIGISDSEPVHVSEYNKLDIYNT